MTSHRSEKKSRNAFFSPPIFPNDEEKTLRARVLHTAIWTFILMASLILAGSLAGGRTPTTTKLINLIIIVLFFFMRYLIQKGWTQEVGVGTIVVMFIGVTFSIIGLGTIRAPVATLYVTIVVTAGLLFGKKELVITTALTALTLLILLYAENSGWLPAADFTVTITQWTTYVVVIGSTATIILTTKNIADETLARARTEIELRKKSEETLKLFSRAIEHNPASIVITDVQGNITSVNPKFTQLTGYTLEEALGQNPKILKSGEQPLNYYEKLWKTILRGDIWHGIFRNRKKNGEFYWEKASIAPVFNDEGAITHFVAIKEDITDRKQAEEELQKANQALKEQIEQIENLQTTLREQAIRDPLTQLYNRRYLEETLKREYSRSQREKYIVSLVMLDMDHLKTINDTGGHALGDQAIRRLADHLKQHVRSSDTVCRIGGDEFAVVMPKTSAQDALKRAEAWNKKIQEITLLHIHDKILRITFTAGVAAYPDHGKTMEEVLNYADVALYRAKTKGRNRVELFEL